jgi:predicted SnoaL-like aldol condensation-catalyzing enzyme
MALSNKQKVVDLLNSLENGDPAPVAYINAEKYIQHNLAVADGLSGFAELVKNKPAAGFKVNVVRAFQDGEYVFTHTGYDFFGPKIAFDIFRFENGKIVEHWDNLQTTVTDTANGHSMIDGPTNITDIEKTAANKAYIKGFVEQFLVNGNASIIPDYIKPAGYIQHNPHIADGLEGLQQALAYFAANNIGFSYTKIHKVLGEGNFVLVVSEGQMAGVHSSFYDLFRVEQGKIAEHWDTIEAIPEKSAWKNNNGKF